jgi:hypothetical protein
MKLTGFLCAYGSEAAPDGSIQHLVMDIHTPSEPWISVNAVIADVATDSVHLKTMARAC